MLPLDRLPLNSAAKIVAIDWAAMSDAEGQRLRALGITDGAGVTAVHRGMFGFRDPLAVRVGRMMIALRRAHAAAIRVLPEPQ
ncbi:MAG: FeoA family protein [Parasphingorhabdus sp.]|nr:FeoA family protein [Parasphingorhabdus sp.]